MKTALIFAAALSFAASQGFAADLPSRTPAPAYVPSLPVFTWTGFYVGVNGGYNWGSRDINVASTPVYVNTVDFGNPSIVNFAAAGGTAALSGGNGGAFIGGGQIGYNWQSGSLVAGFETDIQGLGGNNKSYVINSTQPAAYSPLYTTMTASQRVDWLGTVRGRLGFTVTPSLLVYATGGLAYGEVKSGFGMSQSHLTSKGPTTFGETAASYSATKAGWTLGGGLEWAFASNWSAKIEYLYYDLGHATYDGGLLTSALPNGPVRYSIDSAVSTKYNGDIIRAGVNYRFN